jgi:hypothetical protein
MISRQPIRSGYEAELIGVDAASGAASGPTNEHPGASSSPPSPAGKLTAADAARASPFSRQRTAGDRPTAGAERRLSGSGPPSLTVPSLSSMWRPERRDLGHVDHDVEADLSGRR